METAEIAIIGAGVMGAATAWALTAGGMSPHAPSDLMLLEQHEPGHVHGSSHGATRIFRTAYDDPFYIDLAQRSLPLWRDLERAAGRDLLDITGGVDFAATEYLSVSASAMSACGAAAQILDEREVRTRFPMLSFGSVPALYSPDTGVLAAAASVQAMLGLSGIPIRRVTATSIAIDGDEVIINGALRARRLIVAAGGWTAPLLEPLEICLPLQVSREQVLYFASRPENPQVSESLPVVIERGEIMRYIVPARHGAAGAKAGEHATGILTTATDRDFDIEPAGQDRVTDWIAAAVPSLRPAPVAHETCLYTLSPDEDFIIGVKGPVVYASPCSGHGFKFAPMIGRMLAALATGAPPPVPLERFSLQRFG